MHFFIYLLKLIVLKFEKMQNVDSFAKKSKLLNKQNSKKHPKMITKTSQSPPTRFPQWLGSWLLFLGTTRTATTTLFLFLRLRVFYLHWLHLTLSSDKRELSAKGLWQPVVPFASKQKSTKEITPARCFKQFNGCDVFHVFIHQEVIEKDPQP